MTSNACCWSTQYQPSPRTEHKSIEGVIKIPYKKRKNGRIVGHFIVFMLCQPLIHMEINKKCVILCLLIPNFLLFLLEYPVSDIYSICYAS
jgi:hypothetical protein